MLLRTIRCSAHHASLSDRRFEGPSGPALRNRERERKETANGLTFTGPPGADQRSNDEDRSAGPVQCNVGLCRWPARRARDDFRAEAIAAREHGRIRRRRRDVRGIGALEQRCLCGESIKVRRRQPRIAVTTHVIREDRIDREEQDVRLFGFRVVASRCRSL